MANTPRFCPVCRRGETTVDAEGTVRAVYPPTCQAMLPLTLPSGNVVAAHDYGVCLDCHTQQARDFYEIENKLHPRPAVEDVYALAEMLPPMNQTPTIEVSGGI